MSLARKTLLIIGASVATLVVGTAAAAYLLILPPLEKIEEDLLRSDVRRAARLLESELITLQDWVVEYAQWDDAYAEIAAGRFDFATMDLDITTQRAYRVHLVLAMDDNGEVLSNRGLDLETGQELPIPQSVVRELQRTGARALEDQRPKRGLMLVPEGPWLVALEPVVGQPAGSPVGVLAMGRRLDDRLTAKLARDVELVLSFERLADPGVASQLGATTAASGPRSVTVSATDRRLRGRLLLRDLDGAPTMALAVDRDRELRGVGLAEFRYLLAAVLIVGLGVGLVAWRVSDSYILAPLRRLGARIRASDGSDTRSRITGPLGPELLEAIDPILSELGDSQLRLRASEDKLRDIVAHSSNLFYAHEANFDFTYLSPQVRDFFDCPADQIGNLNDLLTGNTANQEGLALKRAAMQTGERPPVYELELCGPGGRAIWVEVNEAPVVDASGSPAMVGALADVTARRRADDERAKLEEQLRHSQKMDATGRLAGGVAHDLNNLIMVINGFGGMLRQRLSGDGTSQSHLDEIARAAQRAEGLTKQLLAFSRKQRLTLRPLDLNVVVNEMVSMLRRVIGEDVILRTQLAEGLSRVMADRSQLEQVIVNLAINARDAMPGGGTLTIETAPVPESDSSDDAEGRRNFVGLIVRDTGTGMDPDTQSKIFEPFFTTKGEGKGTGLGLATCYGIVKQTGGSIEVSSSPGAGSRFEVRLPKTEALAQLVQAAAQKEATVRGSETVLLVEDEEMVRNLLRRALEEAGFEVLETGDPTEALAIGRNAERIDLLVTDVVMPKLSGKELAGRLTAVRPDLPVLYMSGYTGDALGNMGTLAEDVEFLRKPFDPDALIERVRGLLDARGRVVAGSPDEPAEPRS